MGIFSDILKLLHYLPALECPEGTLATSDRKRIRAQRKRLARSQIAVSASTRCTIPQ